MMCENQTSFPGLLRHTLAKILVSPIPDFGIETLEELVEKTSFPWLISNVMDNETGRPLAEGKITHIMEWWGRKIGLVGLPCNNT